MPNKKNNNEIMKEFLILIGYLEIAKEIDSFNDIKEDYNNVLKELKKWAKDYFLNNSFKLMTYDETLKIHDLLEEISYNKIFDKEVGIECEISDSIRIWYEELMMSINKEIKNNEQSTN